MRIVDHVYFGWESDVGYPISCNRFAVAEIRFQLPPDAVFLRWYKISGDRTNGLITTVGGIFGKF
jgi:hypothetical protein